MCVFLLPSGAGGFKIIEMKNEIEEYRKRLAKKLIMAMYNAGVFVPFDEKVLVSLTALADDFLETHERFIDISRLKQEVDAINN